MIKSKILKDYKNINHGFFNRIGGNSTGIYKSLNCGLGSLDKKQNVQKNLDIVCKKIGCKKNHLILLKTLKIKVIKLTQLFGIIKKFFIDPAQVT